MAPSKKVTRYFLLKKTIKQTFKKFKILSLTEKTYKTTINYKKSKFTKKI